ncbi:hypothetical protein [Corynebacterium meridianum]|uniref:Uncharacterized protein n=1 Tax=Corynebacterium meridianum TaxID=2765363 RepID=A0A934I6K2_9CORY|nr:hypothetical protein [Corynebacterium meridianum]MBI8989986.1 hypothetical protein [Corynebacterium meridianum]MCK7677597.1 hypothetical protein [Corynebacterium meridianum]
MKDALDPYIGEIEFAVPGETYSRYLQFEGPYMNTPDSDRYVVDLKEPPAGGKSYGFNSLDSVSYTPKLSEAGSDIDIPVEVIYADGTSEEISFKLHVIGTADLDGFRMAYGESNSYRGLEASISPRFYSGYELVDLDTVPEGAEFSLEPGYSEGLRIDPRTGIFSYVPSGDAEFGSVVEGSVILAISGRDSKVSSFKFTVRKFAGLSWGGTRVFQRSSGFRPQPRLSRSSMEHRLIMIR